MTSRKRYLLITTAVALLAIGGTASAIIPVFDAPAVEQAVQSFLEQEKAFGLQLEQYGIAIKEYLGDEFSWLTQAKQYATELQHYYQDVMLFINFAHHPTLGAAMGFMNMAGLSNSLPFNPYAAMNLVNGFQYGSGGFSQIGGILNALSGMAEYSYSQNHLYTPTDASWASQQLIAGGNGIYGSQGAASATYGDMRLHEAVLPSLRSDLLTSDTTKDTLDASGQIQAEIAWSLNAMGQAQQVATMAVLQQQARAQRDEERLACELEMFRTGGGACPSGAPSGSMIVGGGGPNGGSTMLPTPPIPPGADGSGNVALGDTPLPTPPAPPEQPPPETIPPPPPEPLAPPPAAVTPPDQATQDPAPLPPGVLTGTPISPLIEGPTFPNPAILPNHP